MDGSWTTKVGRGSELMRSTRPRDFNDGIMPAGCPTPAIGGGQAGTVRGRAGGGGQSPEDGEARGTRRAPEAARCSAGEDCGLASSFF